MQLDLLSKVPHIYGLCKWAALIIAILAALNGIIVRTEFKFLRISRIKILASSTIDSIKLLNSDDFDDLDDDDFENDENDTCSSLSLSSDEERKSEDEREKSFGRRFSWSDFATGNSVVRLWNNLASGFDLDEEENNDIVLVWSDKANNNNDDNWVRKASTDSKVEGLSLRRRVTRGAKSGGVNSFCNCSDYAKCNCSFSSNHVYNSQFSL